MWQPLSKYIIIGLPIPLKYVCLLFQPSPQQIQPLFSQRAPAELSNSWHKKVNCSCLHTNYKLQPESAWICKSLRWPDWHYKGGAGQMCQIIDWPSIFKSVTTSYCMLRMVLVVSCIKRLKIIRIISDKDWNVAAMFHQVLLMFCLKVTTPL